LAKEWQGLILLPREILCLDGPYLFKCYFNQIFISCILDDKVTSIALSFYHDQACERAFQLEKDNIQTSSMWLLLHTLFRDAFEYRKNCPRCQQLGRIRKRDMTSLNAIVVMEIFDAWDFMEPFLSSFSNEYVLLVVDYVLSRYMPSILRPMVQK